MITWDIKIDAEGNASSAIKGVKGDGCKAVTKDFEKELGTVVADAPTKEMHEREEQRNYNKSRS